MHKVEQVFEGEWTEWAKTDRFQCCDCLAIHDIEFRVRKGKVQVRVYRNNRSTAAYRRENGIRLVKNGGGHD